MTGTPGFPTVAWVVGRERGYRGGGYLLENIPFLFPTGTTELLIRTKRGTAGSTGMGCQRQHCRGDDGWRFFQ